MAVSRMSLGCCWPKVDASSKRDLSSRPKCSLLRCSQIECHLGPIERFSQRLLRDIQKYQRNMSFIRPRRRRRLIRRLQTEMHAKPNKSEGLLLLAKGRKHLLAGELDSAKEIAVRVYSMNLGLTPSDGDTPEQLYSDYKRALARKSGVRPFLSSGSPSGRTSHFDPGFE